MADKGIINPTYIDYVMLGIIQRKPISGYGILKVLKQIIPGNFSCSPGTIYPALKRLQKFGLIQVRSKEGSSRKSFQLSSRGQVFLIAWLLDPISIEDVRKRREELLLRFTFMNDLVSQTEKKHFLLSFHEQVKKYVQELSESHQKALSIMNAHQQLSLEHEIGSYKASLKWSKRALREM